jgi:putative endonuclease
VKHWVYIVECSDKTYYTGYSNDIDKRIEKHNSGRGAKYTRTRRPVKLVYKEKFETKSEALKREYEIKQKSRKEKIGLIHPWPTLEGRLANSIVSRKEALTQLKRDGMVLSELAKKDLDKYEW